MHRLVEGWINQYKYGSLLLLGVAVVCSVLEQNFSLRRFKKPWRETALDLQYFFASLLYPPTVNFGISTVLAWLMIQPEEPATLNISRTWFWVQLLTVLFIDDVWVYIRHRFFHSKTLWAYHTLHHYSENVTWSSGQRQHPIEVFADLIGQTLIFAAFSLVGVNLKVLFWAGLIIGLWNFFVHSNLRWTFGPLRYVIVSPIHHRWHHSDAPEAYDKNFAVMFSCIDIMLGTAYMPKGVFPNTTGISEEEKRNYPKTFLSQIAYPFSVKKQ